MDPVSKAQTDEQSPHSRRVHKNSLKNLQNGKRFKPGQSGNPGGRSKKAYITKIYEDIFASASNRDEIQDSLFLTLKSGRMAGVLLMREAAERLEGKITQEIDINATLQNLTDEQLTARLEKLRGK